MNIYETKDRIEKFLEKEISHLVPQHFADLINEILDKVEGKPNEHESTESTTIINDAAITTTITNDATTTEFVSDGANGAATTSGTESTAS